MNTHDRLARATVGNLSRWLAWSIDQSIGLLVRQPRIGGVIKGQGSVCAWEVIVVVRGWGFGD